MFSFFFFLIAKTST